MEKFHITIKNNETGEILVDDDTCAIIGALDRGEGTGCLGFTVCGPVDLAATATGALKAALRCSRELPAVIQDAILEKCALKRKTNFLEKIFGKKGGKA